MPVTYTPLMDRLYGDVQRVFGERIRIEPQTEGDRRNLASDDPERPAVELTARVLEGAETADMGAFQGGQWNASVPADHFEIRVPVSAMPAYPLRDNDRIVFLDRGGSATVFRVEAVGATIRVIRATPVTTA